MSLAQVPKEVRQTSEISDRNIEQTYGSTDQIYQWSNAEYSA